ncbi:5-hydroxytryptamine receptor 2B-like [Neosynchiropus ocellatus]
MGSGDHADQFCTSIGTQTSNKVCGQACSTMSQRVGAPVGDNSSGLETEYPLQWASLLIIMVIIPTIGGNILVILAVSLERKLQNATNYFLMSLAVADLLVGLLVMPIALITILYNSGWPLPDFICPIWLFLDVLFSTASIMHLCAISLDRYIAIKKPIQHSQNKSRAKALVKIGLVWLISIGIAMPIPIKGLQDYHPHNITFNANHTCQLMTDAFWEFKLIGSLTAFFIPLTIMMVIYLLTVHVLRKKVNLLRSKVIQRCSYSTVSTIFQKDYPIMTNNAEKLNMLERRLSRIMEKSNINRANFPPTDDTPFRRMSAMGKKSMQTLSNEQRASKVLGIVFLLFVIMWCPFFITNISSVLCASCDEDIIAHLMEIFVWVGYVSSGINPLVYTLFNKTFRQAFSRLITFNYRKFPSHGHDRSMNLSQKDRTCKGTSLRTSVAENSKQFVNIGMNDAIGKERSRNGQNNQVEIASSV